jgi:hypothetical protein
MRQKADKTEPEKRPASKEGTKRRQERSKRKNEPATPSGAVLALILLAEKPMHYFFTPSILLSGIASELEPALKAFGVAAGTESTAGAGAEVDLDERREGEVQASEEVRPLASEHVRLLSTKTKKH